MLKSLLSLGFSRSTKLNVTSCRGLADAIGAGPGASLGPGLAEIGTPKQHRKWPLDLDGTEIRTATARKLGISTSTWKLNLVARLVRGLSISEAQRQLAGLKKKHKVEVSQTIAAAVTNARSFGMKEDRLIVSKAFVGKGKYLKYIRPWHGKGRYGIEHKKYAHLNVEVKELSDEQWEAKVLPQYVHMRYRRRSEKKRSLPESIVRPWEIRSQLDLSLASTRARVEELRSRLPRKGLPYPLDWKPDAAEHIEQSS